MSCSFAESVGRRRGLPAHQQSPRNAPTHALAARVYTQAVYHAEEKQPIA